MATRLSVRIPAVIAAVHVGQAWWMTALSRFGSAEESSAKFVGASIGLLAVAAVAAFGIVQVWRLRRSGLLILAGLYFIVAARQLVEVREGRGSRFGVAFSAIMLVTLLSPHAWRVCGRRSEWAGSRGEEPAEGAAEQ